MRNADQYPENWKDEIRPAILKRDNYKCRECRIKHRAYVVKNPDLTYSEITLQQMVVFREQGKKAFRIFLQVAHLDNVKSNVIPSNLISLCPPCHLKLDQSFKNLLRKTNKAELIKSLGGTPSI